MIHHGDCLDVMAAMEPDSIDAVCTDPPYGLGFMGKEWDDASRLASVPPSAVRAAEAGFDPYPRTGKGPTATAFDGTAFQHWCEQWASAALRVARPGAYLLAFGGTRTVHRMTVALEDAGWIIRDMLVWGYASGFPKSRALLKPAWEPIVMARKPGPLRDLDIDGCRIGTDGGTTRSHQAEFQHEAVTGQVHATRGYRTGHDIIPTDSGRWPANVVLTDPIFDGGWDGVVGGGETSTHAGTYQNDSQGGWFGANPKAGTTVSDGDTGTYSRFYLVAKASRSDREPVMPGTELRPFAQSTGARKAIERGEAEYQGADASTGLNRIKQRANVHPTVKPIELMRHLVRLVTPAGGTVLDPFAGSGSTLLAADQEGFAWVGIEREREYVDIINARMVGNQTGMGLSA